MKHTLNPSQDQAQLRHDLDEFGLCIVDNALPSDLTQKIQARITEQAEIERSQGLTPLDDVQLAGGDDGNQYVYMLLNKGLIFQQLLMNKLVRSLVGHVLGEHYLLSDMAAIIAHPGNRAMGMHIDQWFLPTPSDPGTDRIKAGSLNRRNLHTGPPQPSKASINGPVVCNALWMISDFTTDNGATRLVPGSHLSGCHPSGDDPSNTIQVTGRAGNAVIFEGRTWHAAAVNHTEQPRYGISTYYCAPQIRQMANFTYGTRQDVVDDMSADVRALLGFEPWGGYGATGDPSSQQICRGEDTLGELHR